MAAGALAAYRPRCMLARNSHFLWRVLAWPRRLLVAIAVTTVLLLAGRLALPGVVKRVVNERLQRIPGYNGHVNAVDLHFWRGAYTLRDVGIVRQSGRVQEPFFRARTIDFSLAWRELWLRRIVSNVRVDHVELNLVHGPSAEETQTDLDHRWLDVIDELFPIAITRMDITDGLLRYVDTTRQPMVNVFVTHLRATATGLRNRPDETPHREFPAEITAEGDSLGAGKLKFVLAADPLAAEPHFQLRLQLDHVHLPALNDSLRAYANVDVGRGTFRLVAEMAGREGGFQGYVKPFFEGLDFQNVEDKDKAIGARLWEHAVAGLAWLVKNKSRDQLATRIPFEGRFGDAKVGLFATLTNLFRHGFIRAYNPTIEGTIRAENVLSNDRRADGKDVANNAPDENPDPTKRSASR